MNNKLIIKEPCLKDWSKMKIGLNSRQCSRCNKSVIDFTKMEKDEILIYLLKNRNKNVCGRIQKNKLDYSNKDLKIIIQKKIKVYKKTNKAFYFLALSSLLALSCENQNATKLKDNDNQNTKQIMEQNIKTICTKDTILADSLDIEIPFDEFIMGDLIVEDFSQTDKKSPYLIAEVMPEFPGGFDSLISYLNSNIEYPKWEYESNIQGKVYVSIVIDTLGEVKDIEIKKSVKKALNFDKEVIRVIKNMPNWTPGKEKGKKVDVQMIIPIHFQIE